MTTALLRRGQSMQVADCEKVGGLPKNRDGVVTATKGGLTRGGPGAWEQVGRPE